MHAAGARFDQWYERDIAIVSRPTKRALRFHTGANRLCPRRTVRLDLKTRRR
jgi:hypothetical protein